MKNRFAISPATWFTLIFACLITGYLYWFYTHFDKVIEERDIGPNKEVRLNPFFAAEKFLVTLGKEAKSEKNYSILDQQLKPFDALIIESTRVGLNTEKRQKIKDWITIGGHLILLATEVYDDDLGSSRDNLLDELGVRLYQNSGSTLDLENDQNLTTVTFEDVEIKTTIAFGLDYFLQDVSGNASFVGGNDYSDLFVQYEYGQGMISVLTDMNIWKNDYIDDYDHAMFLNQLTGGAENIWFLYNTVQPSLMSMMVDLIPMILISLFLLIIVILYSASWRKGPAKNDQLRIQRKIMQHIEAAGEFSYRNDSGKVLLADVMATLESRLRKSIHRYEQIDVEKKITKLSQLTGKTKKELSILWLDNENNQDSFIKKILLIQELKKQL